MDATTLMTGSNYMDPSEKRELDAFIAEYMKDYDSYRATLRLNYDPEVALERAKQFWDHPYVQQCITEIQENRSALWKQNEQRDLSRIPEDFVPSDEDLDKQRIVSALFREAFYRGPGSTHSARVAALSKLSAIYKLEHEKPPEADGRSVMVVPATGNLDEWEKGAAKQQEKLKQEVKL